MTNGVNEQPQMKQEQPCDLSYRDDEIRLLDLARILVRQKKIIYVTFLVCLILGAIYAVLTPKNYRYSTTIEIGSVMEDGKTTLIDLPGTLLAKINEAYIPYVIEQFTNKNKKDESIYEIRARIPQGSEVIVLESNASEDKEKILMDLHWEVVDLVKRNHKRVFDIIKKEMGVELNKSENKLASFQDRQKVLISDLKRLDRTAKLLNKQVEDLKVLVEDAIQNRQQARTQISDESRAMTLLMIDNEIQQNTQRLAALEERLYVGLPRERDYINNLIAENSREQQEQSADIAKIKMALINMRESRALIAPMKSVKPVGTSKRMIFITSIVGGLIAGLVAAFFLEFINNIQRGLRAKGRASHG